MDKKVHYWINLAKEDLEVSQVLFNNNKFLYSGFMCHLAVEKMLKAKIEAQGITPPKIHNLNRLAEIANILNDFSDEQKNLLNLLNPLQIEARYPTHKQQIEASLTLELCKKIIQQTKELVEWIEMQL